VEILIEGKLLHNIKFAVQDTDEKILENIERPDIPYHEHRQYIDNVAKKHPHLDIGIELIQGLPGQTRTTWEQNLIKIQPYNPVVYFWNILPNSPAGYDQVYKEKMQLKTHFCNLIDHDDNEYAVNKKMEFVTSTYSYSFEDYCYFTILTKICTLPSLTETHKHIDRSVLFDMIKNSIHLNDCINSIKYCIENNHEHQINSTVIDFLKKFVKEFYSIVSKEYVVSVITGTKK
jgi:hypothetical protein